MAPSPDEPTRTAASLGAPTSQPVVAPALFRAAERYQILGEHGRGGLGRVSRAHDLELGRDVAIKELISRGALSEVRFLREAMITARLEHPGIVPVHEAGRWPDGTPYYAMKLVAGRPLRELIAERTTIDQRIGLLHHVIAVADAIAYAHGRNIIHRDLKPANVIVGDFGETIVIDWGLAKDVSETEESTVGGGPFRAPVDNGLTATGAILGTPTYMAPEQERGEHVDQRADVYAIGAMLWELCSLHKVPPTSAAVRHRLLRRAGIDKDLAVILDKALDPDAARRYPDAGALAADLKAFKSGARISARSYSLFAMLAHWTHRHRALAMSITAAVVLLVGGSILYVRNVAAERDRADTALNRAEAAKNDLILEHAALLLHTDPTAAVAALGGSRSDSMRRSQLVAEARGRGVAHSILHPHNDTIWFLAGQPDGSFISVGEDRRVRRTVGTSTTSLASNVSTTVYCAYSPTRRLLAYSASPRGVAVMDLTTSTTVTLDTNSPVALAFSPDGSQLAALDKHGALVVWKTSPAPTEILRRSFPGATKLNFNQPSRLLLIERAGARSLDLANATSVTSDRPISAIDGHEPYVAAGLTDGTLAVLSQSLDVIAKAPACKQHVKIVRILPKRDLIAFDCEKGGAGLARYSPSEHALTVIDTFDVADTREWRLAVDAAEANLIVISNRTTYIYNIDTRITRRLEGQAGMISAIAAPGPGFPYVLVGDVNGTVRIWTPPAPKARVLAKVPAFPFTARFSPDGTLLAVVGLNPVAQLIRLADASTTELRGHTEMIRSVRFSPDGRSLLTYSWDGTARAWQTSDGSLLRAFPDHRSILEDGAFIKNGDRVVTIADDGHLFAWDPRSDDVQSFLTHSSPLISLVVLPVTGNIVVRDSAGAFWEATPGGKIEQIRKGDDVGATMMRASSNGRLLAMGREDGSLTIYSTTDWTVFKSLKMGGTIARIDFDPEGRDMLVHSEDGFVHLIPLDTRRSLPWRDFQVDARDIAYDPSGELIAVSTVDGGIWFYSIPRASWSYHQDHTNGLRFGRFSPDGTRFISIDQGGMIVARDPSTVFDQQDLDNALFR